MQTTVALHASGARACRACAIANNGVELRVSGRRGSAPCNGTRDSGVGVRCGPFDLRNRADEVADTRLLINSAILRSDVVSMLLDFNRR